MFAIKGEPDLPISACFSDLGWAKANHSVIVADSESQGKP
jgi:hypothetical protein